MQISKMRGLVAGAVTAFAVLGSGVGVASAAPAVWNTTGAATVTLPAPLVLKVKVTPTTTYSYSCAAANLWTLGAGATNSAGQARLAFAFEGHCTGPDGALATTVSYYGPNPQNLLGEKVGSAYQLKGSDSAALTINSPGGYWQSNFGRGANYTVPWTNGTNPLVPISTATFNNTQVGITSSGQGITLSGVVQFKTAANGLLTLI